MSVEAYWRLQKIMELYHDFFSWDKNVHIQINTEQIYK